MATTTRFAAAVKAELLTLVTLTQQRTGWTVRRILQQLGLSRARARDWVERQARDALADRPSIARHLDGILHEERAAVEAYALQHPKDGYRRLTWQMIDDDVAYLSPSRVYRILRDADLLCRWKRSASLEQAPPKPTRPHERWHTDLMYLRIADHWYFLVTVIDAYSRYVVHWELLTTMTANDVQLRIRTYHPESNGVIVRFHRTTREALAGAELRTLGRARELIGEWVRHCNEERLHAALGYLPPAEYYRGAPAARHAARRVKLDQALARRRQTNQARLKCAA